jgi:hypothetical protein
VRTPLFRSLANLNADGGGLLLKELDPHIRMMCSNSSDALLNVEHIAQTFSRQELVSDDYPKHLCFTNRLLTLAVIVRVSILF